MDDYYEGECPDCTCCTRDTCHRGSDGCGGGTCPCTED